MISLALVPAVREDRARQLAARLEEAVGEGRMVEVDECSSALLALALLDPRAELEDEAWFEINKTIRQAIPDYAAPYLLDPSICARLAEVLRREQASVLLDLIQSAADSGSLLLQLPCDVE
ncbi:MAG: hypothetical protein JWL59_4330 [Chthoniobacteraceae bacterium]|nr:hypothetical protein [Chthoniobacteraceae bacterium]